MNLRIDGSLERTGDGLRELSWATRARVVRPSPGANGWGPTAELCRYYEMLPERRSAANRREPWQSSGDGVRATAAERGSAARWRRGDE